MNKVWLLAVLLIVVSCGEADTKEQSATTITDTITATTKEALVPDDTTASDPAPLAADTPIKKETVQEVKPQPKPEAKQAIVKHCYLRVEGAENKDTNYVRLTIDGNLVTGKYIVSYEGVITRGDLNGKKKGNVITADWNFVNGQNYYSIPVAFKMKRFALFQKPTAINENKVAYIPEEGEYDIKYKEIDCGNAN